LSSEWGGLMAEFLSKLWQQFNNFWTKTTPLQKIKIGIIVIAALASIILLVIFTSQPEYVPLFTNLNLNDAGEIIAKLEELKIPYKISNEGTSVLVPIKDVYKTRMQLANEGLPRGGIVGFSEILEKTKLGTTDWERQIQYNHALQGELTRTIKEISAVQDARVHIVIPKKSLFADPQKKDIATAAIFLKLKPTMRLSQEQVKGIIHLVSNSVEGLTPENVTVIDVNGRILSSEITDSQLADSQLVKNQLDLQMTFQQNLENSVQTLLEQVFGPGNVVVRATAQMNFDKKVVEKNLFEPVVNEEGIIRSIQELEEYFKGSGGQPGGVPGVDSNITYQEIQEETSEYEKRDVIKNYEINEIRENLVVSPGSVEKLSIAVVINKELSDEDKQKISQLVSSTIGANPERDSITVEGMSFDVSLQEEINKQMELQKEQRQLLLKRALIIGAGFLALLMILYNRWAAARRRKEQEALLAPSEIASEAAIDLGEEKNQSLKDIERLVKKKPENVAQLLRTWLTED